jgi:hydroxymethylglutaryl-CoA lyase
MNPTPSFQSTAALPRRVVVREMGLRDGLQSVRPSCPPPPRSNGSATPTRPASARSKSAPSCRPLLPQLADTAEVLAFAQTLPGLRASVLVPNLKGAERASPRRMRK